MPAEPAPRASTPQVADLMRRQGRRDTAPELALRGALHRLGLRFRVDRRPSPRLRTRADVVFGPARVAVFVDGCFWHGCPEHGAAPKANAAWWREKPAENRRRDATATAALRAEGWAVVRVWQHEDPTEAARAVAAVVRSRRGARSGHGRT